MRSGTAPWIDALPRRHGAYRFAAEYHPRDSITRIRLIIPSFSRTGTAQYSGALGGPKGFLDPAGNVGAAVGVLIYRSRVAGEMLARL